MPPLGRLDRHVVADQFVDHRRDRIGDLQRPAFLDHGVAEHLQSLAELLVDPREFPVADADQRPPRADRRQQFRQRHRPSVDGDASVQPEPIAVVVDLDLQVRRRDVAPDAETLALRPDQTGGLVAHRMNLAQQFQRGVITGRQKRHRPVGRQRTQPQPLDQRPDRRRFAGQIPPQPNRPVLGQTRHRLRRTPRHDDVAEPIVVHRRFDPHPAVATRRQPQHQFRCNLPHRTGQFLRQLDRHEPVHRVAPDGESGRRGTIDHRLAADVHQHRADHPQRPSVRDAAQRPQARRFVDDDQRRFGGADLAQHGVVFR